MHRLFQTALSAGLLALTSSHVLANENDTFIPPGFEALSMEQSIYADFYYGGINIGNAKVTYKPGFVQIDAPQDIVENLKNITDKAAVTNALTGFLPNNAGKSCNPVRLPGCGVIEVPVAGVIFDQSIFRLDINVNPDYVTVENPDIARYFDTPDSGLSYLQSMRFNSSVSENASEKTTTYNLSGTSLVGYNDMRLRVESTYNSEDKLFLDEVFYDTELKDAFIGGGLFRTEGTGLLSSKQIYGGVYANSLRTRADQAQLSSNEIIVFFSSASQVEFLKDGRLLDVQRYPQGNQVLDTRNLPYGTYDITLRITDVTGAITEDTRLFIKDRSLPPVGETFYTAEAGLITDSSNNENQLTPEASSDHMVRIGIRTRPNDSYVYGFNAFNYVNDFGVSADARAFWGKIVADASVIASSKSNIGALFGMNWSNEDISVSGRLIKTEIQDTTDSSPIYGIEGGSSTQATGQLGFKVGDGNLRLFATLSESESQAEQITYGAGYSTIVHSDDDITVSLATDITHSSDDTQMNLSLVVRGNVEKANYSAEFGSSKSDLSGQTTFQRVTAGYQISDIGDSEDILVDGSLANYSNGTNQMRANAKYISGYGSYNAGTEIIETDLGGRQTRYSLSGNGAFSINKDGFSWGSGAASEAGVMVVLEGAEKSDARFNVFLDGQVAFKGAKSGDKIMIPAAPYREHSVWIRGIDAPSVKYDLSPRVFAPFPGNIMTQTFNIKGVYVALGRIIDSKGEGIGGARVVSDSGVSQTSPKGYLQIDLSGDSTVEVTTKDGGVCTASISVGDGAQEFVRFGEAQCM